MKKKQRKKKKWTLEEKLRLTALVYAALYPGQPGPVL